jgi:hypothetical protein
MPGRPRKLSESKQAEVCALIRAGCTMAATARYVGCSPLTIQREARRNPEFCEKLRNIRYDVELNPVLTLRDAAINDWRAAAWILERTQPQHYAKRPANSFSPQEVADLLERVCDVIRQETRDAQTSARIKRRVLALAHAKIDRPDDNPFRPQLVARTEPAPSPAAHDTQPISMPPPSKADQNPTQKKPVLICAADLPPSNSRHFTPAHAS